MRQRLLIQHEVAAAEWRAQLAIADPKREQGLLEKVESQAGALGLEGGFVREFFQAQLLAGKLVQQADFDGWRQAGTLPAAGPDFKTLRVRIDDLNRQLLVALKDTRPWPDREAGRKALEGRADALLKGEGITGEVRQLACAPLLHR
jgi:chorismate mutase